MKFRYILYILGISAVPLIEQRGSIPIGILTYDLHPLLVFAVCFLGSLLPAPFILLFFNAIYGWMEKVNALKWFTNFVDRKIRKGSAKIGKYKEIGLILFIAIPLPTTGIWTGTAVAAFLGLDFKKSLFCAAIGGFISALIITIVCLTIPTLLGLKA